MEDDYGSVLNNPLSMSDLLKNGAQFEVNANFDDNNDMFEDINICGSDDEYDDFEIIVSPWEKTFDELRVQMKKVSEDIYKRVTKKGLREYGAVPESARVIIEYNAYWEKAVAPFDSTFLRGEPYKFNCGNGEVVEGLEKAVMTMLKGEEAQFVISYNLLFHEMGCPPRVKPKADGLFIVKLIDFMLVGDANATDDIAEEDRNKFSIVKEKVKDVHLKGLDFYKQENIHYASKLFHKAVNALELCRLENEKDQVEQREFLVKLYTNLAVCYNRLDLPTKTCCMCNEIRRIADINQNCKALFQEGRAMLMIGEFRRSRTLLLQASRLEPNNQEIINELKVLAQKYETYRSNEKVIWKKAMGVMEDSKERRSTSFDHLVGFKNQIEKIIKDFKTMSESDQLTLPKGLSEDEVKCVDELVKEFELQLKVSESDGNMIYTIVKVDDQI